jgi:hypothetical protein
VQGADGPCGLTTDRPVAWRAARCVRATSARVLGLAPDPRGGAIAVGSFSGDVGFEQPLAFAGQNAFVAALGPDLGTRWRTRLEAPGAPRAFAVDARGVAIVSGSPEAPEGPFFTRYDLAGSSVARRDLQLGGLTTGAAPVAGGYLLRHQAGGVHVVRIDDAGGVVGSARLTPAYVHDFPASLEENGLVPDEAVDSAGGAYTPVMVGPALEPGGPEVGLVRVAPNGAVMWTRGVKIGRRAQIAAVPGGLVLLSRDAAGVCKEGDAFAVVRVDGEGTPSWTRCFAARTSDLRLAVRPDGAAVIAGQFTGSLDVGDGAHVVSEGALASFVFALGPDGALRGRSVALGEPLRFVAIQALAALPDGTVLLGGAAGTALKPRAFEMTHLFVAELSL